MLKFFGWPVALVLTLAVTVGAVLAFVSLRNEREYARLVVAGDAALAATDLAGAIEAYTGAITLRPDSMVAISSAVSPTASDTNPRWRCVT